jgi:predicted transposase YdaD
MNIHDQDTFRRGKKEGAEQKAIETAKKLLEIGMPIEQVANITVLSEEVVKSLFNEQNK